MKKFQPTRPLNVEIASSKHSMVEVATIMKGIINGIERDSTKTLVDGDTMLMKVSDDDASLNADPSC